MDQFRLSLSHRRRRLMVIAQNLPQVLFRYPPQSLPARRRAYFWSRVLQLGKRARRYRLLAITRLDHPNSLSDGDDTPVWELRLLGPRFVRHRAGDTLLLRWTNPPERVDEVLAALDADGTRRYPIVTYSSVFQPGRLRYVQLRTILEEDLDIYTAGPALLGSIPGGTTPSAVPGLDRLAPDAAGGGRGVNVVSLIRATTPPITVRQFLRHQTRNQPRAYSLSRIVPHRRRDEIEIVVSAVHTHLKEPTGPIRATDGRATAYVRRLAAQFGFHNLSGRNQLQAWSLRHPWRLDVLEERPAILIVTGTGIAGALAWLRTRPAPSARTPAESDLERGREDHSASASETFHTDRGNTPPVWLIYGVRDWAERGLYQAELQRMVLAGRISRFDIAQSRSSTPADEPTEATAKLYHSARVTDIVQAEEVEIAQWVRDGAAVYVSGARSMGAGVRRRLLDLVVHHQLTDPPEAAPDLLSGWERDGRLQISVS